jgi:acetolactate synthase-1/2/3 large subunit
MFLNDACVSHGKMRYVCNHHEQASAMAAEAYAKAKNRMGAVMVTSGPGSTNTVTGLLEAYQNSVPVIFISSQTKMSQMVANSGVSRLRQFGIQEVDIIPIVRPLTKYAAIVGSANDVRYHLEKAYHAALSGRPGPVWLDIPSDVASARIPESLPAYVPPTKAVPRPNKRQLTAILDRLASAQRPVIVVGGGVHRAGAQTALRTFIERTGIPVVATDMGLGLLEYGHPLYVGHGGTKGDRAANMALQQSDLVISVGSRLAVPFVGHEYAKWAPDAFKIVVDIDPAEHRKKTIGIGLFVKSDAKEFLETVCGTLTGGTLGSDAWREKCRKMKSGYALKLSTVTTDGTDRINMYDAVREISDQSAPGDTFITDAGITAYVTTQGVKIKDGQRMLVPGATLTMGYNLPAVIGAWAAGLPGNVICITGDGSFQMNIHELATIAYHKIPAKIFIMDNQGYLAIRTTQKNFFDGRLIGEGAQSGISFPDPGKIAAAYGFSFVRADTKDDLRAAVAKALRTDGPVICNVRLPYWQDIITVSSRKLDDGRMVSLPIDDMFPFLSPEDLASVRK